MFRFPSHFSYLTCPICILIFRNVASISTTNIALSGSGDATLIEQHLAVMTPEERKQRQAYLENKIYVSEKVIIFLSFKTVEPSIYFY